jgi:hypothetical protein
LQVSSQVLNVIDVFLYSLDSLHVCLLAAGILTVDEAESHWINFGIPEGRQASGAFHSRQYLDAYPDVAGACGGHNYTCAITHYLTYGFTEGRLGILSSSDGGKDYNRWTIAEGNNKGIFLSTSPRMAGGVDSLVWNNFEFTNQWDHGRELQVAFTNGYGECYNPTECGSSDDLHINMSTSVLQSVRVSNTTLWTQSLPAFWLMPGEQEPNPSSICTTAINTQRVSDFQLTKTVSVSANRVQYAFSMYMATYSSQVQLEGPTHYMPLDFNRFFTFDTTSGIITEVSRDSGEVPLPLIFATSDLAYAEGCLGYVPEGWVLSYAKFYFPDEVITLELITLLTLIALITLLTLMQGPISACTSKWSVVYRLFSPTPAGVTYGLNATLCVGSWDQTVACMKQNAREYS